MMMTMRHRCQWAMIDDCNPNSDSWNEEWSVLQLELTRRAADSNNRPTGSLLKTASTVTTRRQHPPLVIFFAQSAGQ
jgi:hypothetical protein